MEVNEITLKFYNFRPEAWRIYKIFLILNRKVTRDLIYWWIGFRCLESLGKYFRGSKRESKWTFFHIVQVGGTKKPKSIYSTYLWCPCASPVSAPRLIYEVYIYFPLDQQNSQEKWTEPGKLVFDKGQRQISTKKLSFIIIHCFIFRTKLIRSTKSRKCSGNNSNLF